METLIHLIGLIKLQKAVFKKLAIFAVLAWAIAFLPKAADAATLQISPSIGTFTVGSTFNVSILVDSEGKNINIVEASLSFPADKLQVVSPSVGESIIGLWVSYPKFDNIRGRVDLVGGIPGGLNTDRGLITTLQFRVKSVGSANIKFLDNSKVLLHDGAGTDDLRSTVFGTYQLVLPPAEGPAVASQTHLDQTKWYANNSVSLSWSNGAAIDGYSYVLNSEPISIPDNITDSSNRTVSYKNLSDGIHYFHIKAIRNGVWGGVTHFAVKVDASPPAGFPIKIIPGARTTRQQPIIEFATTDARSGIHHYEIKIIPLSTAKVVQEVMVFSQPFFVEAQSPYIPAELDYGRYDIIVRVYDNASNYKEEIQRLKITRTIFSLAGDKGIEVKSIFIISWTWLLAILALLLALISYLAWRVRLWHLKIDARLGEKHLPVNIAHLTESLKKYRDKYGKILILFLVIVSVLVLSPQISLAADAGLNPPHIGTVSRGITNEEIFYVGGRTGVPNAEVIIYLQNLQTGEARSETVIADKNGEWFYRHNGFLTSGNYLLWAQSKLGEESSPPSPQIKMLVQAAALQFGASRLSYEVLYLIISLLLLAALIAMVLYTVVHVRHGRRKHKLFMKEVKEAEESVRRGFAVLRRDIEVEIAVIKKAKLGAELSAEEKQKEEHLLRDLADIQRHIGKEIMDIEKAEI